MRPSMRLLAAAILVSLLTGCGPRNEAVTCKDGTFVSGTGARQVCDEHGGVREK